jgi:hypothetical protein
VRQSWNVVLLDNLSLDKRAEHPIDLIEVSLDEEKLPSWMNLKSFIVTQPYISSDEKGWFQLASIFNWKQKNYWSQYLSLENYD